jgi:hypothetical protein
MKISDLKKILTAIEKEHGDLTVVYPDFMTDGCGAGEVLSVEVRKAKAPKKGHIYSYHHGAYAKNRYVKKDCKVIELRDSNYGGVDES